MNERFLVKQGASKTKKMRKIAIFSNLPSWLILSVGISFGVIITSFFYHYHYKLIFSSQKKHDTSVALSNKTKKDSKPIFDFYTSLPNAKALSDEHTPYIKSRDANIKQKAIHKSTIVKTIPSLTVLDSNTDYLLQVGSFRNKQDAQRLNKQLLHWNLQPSISTVKINSIDFWYRVQLGPYKNSKKLNADQALLSQHGLNVLLLKIK